MSCALGNEGVATINRKTKTLEKSSRLTMRRTLQSKDLLEALNDKDDSCLFNMLLAHRKLQMLRSVVSILIVSERPQKE